MRRCPRATSGRNGHDRPGPFTSFDEFYRSQNVRLFHFFRRKVGREAAPDLVQEAFMRMLRCGAFEESRTLKHI